MQDLHSLLHRHRNYPLPLEKKIIAKWNNNIKSCVVSVVCVTFNHQDYIEDALRGFIFQKTSSPFEVLICDDCSTDDTPNIIKKYAKLYPLIIKPIFQLENQHSKGVEVNRVFNLSRVKGDFIAFCEGDDFWVDHHKLQKQIDLITKDNNISMVISQAYNMDLSKDQIKQSDVFSLEPTLDLNMYDALLNGAASLPTCTFLVRHHIAEIVKNHFQDFYVGDIAFKACALTVGKVVWQKGPTACYRTKVPHSHTSRHHNAKSMDLIKLRYRKMIEFVKQLTMLCDYNNQTMKKLSLHLRKNIERYSARDSLRLLSFYRFIYHSICWCYYSVKLILYREH